MLTDNFKHKRLGRVSAKLINQFCFKQRIFFGHIKAFVCKMSLFIAEPGALFFLFL